MGAATGAEFLTRRQEAGTIFEIAGERHAGGVAEHPAFRRIVATFAALYDRQQAPDLADRLTYASPLTGDPVGISFLQPHTQDDLVRRRSGMQLTAEASHGFLGRTGDYLNSELQALAAARDFFGGSDDEFGDNVVRYYEHVREHDLLLTHTQIHPQANRSVRAWEQRDPHLAARVVAEHDDGIVVRGARLLATLGPIADELLVFPSTVVRSAAEDRPYAFAFGIPCDAPGLRFLCRQALDLGHGRWDHPLGSRYDEPDAIVIFDDVKVPWERVFILGEPELCNRLYLETSAVHFMTHQVVTRAIAKTEFFLGLTSLMVDAIRIEGFQHVQEKLAEVIITLETLKALRDAAEAGAEMNQWGIMTPAWQPLNAARNSFPKLAQRLPEIVRQLGASGLIAVPTRADVEGPAGDDIARYLQAAELDGGDRSRLFRLAWDAAVSGFAGRQTLYEYFFFGDPVRMADALLKGYDRADVRQRVEAFLASEESLAPRPLVEVDLHAH